jgi:hypothetical protein
MVVERCRNSANPTEARFLPSKSYFAATAVLRFEGENPGLEFHNPFVIRATESDAGTLPLAVDLSAALARSLQEAP